MTSPEIRYRRLLALYPRAHREEYGEEMLAVLMADGRTGLGTAADLIRGGVAARFRATFVAQGWPSAAHAIQVFGSILLLAIALSRLVGAGVVALFHPMYAGPVPVLDFARTGAWTVALVGGLLGIRLLGVAGAAAGLACEIVAPARYYLDTPAQILAVYWIIVTAVVVVVASLVSVRAGRLGGWEFIAAAGLALIAHSFAVRALAYFELPFWLSYERSMELAAAPAAVLAVIGVARLEPPVRRRVIAFGVPVLVTFPLVHAGFARLVRHNGLHPEAIVLISPAQWAALVLIPLFAFAVAAELNRRLEESRFRAVTGRTSKAP